MRDLSKLRFSPLPPVVSDKTGFMSVIVGFEVDRHVSSPGKRPLDKQTSALSMALNSPGSCDSPASQRLHAAFCCSDQRSDDAEDAYSCYSDEEDDDEDLPNSKCSSQHSMPIPRPSSRCDIIIIIMTNVGDVRDCSLPCLLSSLAVSATREKRPY